MPTVPEETSSLDSVFIPSPEYAAWIKDTFISEGSPLLNRGHDHLQYATIGVLFTNAQRVKRGSTTLGMARLGEPSGSDGWTRALQHSQRLQWFGELPDFIITLQAQYFEEFDAWQRCALIEHELMHCGQQYRDGMPLFSSTTGLPLWAMKGHDAEVFIDEVRRYGAWRPELEELKGVLERGPTLQRTKVEGICGTCGAGV